MSNRGKRGASRGSKDLSEVSYYIEFNQHNELCDPESFIEDFVIDKAEEGASWKEQPKDSKLVFHENVITTPHLGASTKEAREGVAVEIAEAVSGALQGELSATGVNAPMVPNEVLSELAPYVALAEKLGRLAVQVGAGRSGIKSVKVIYRSVRDPDDLDTRQLRAMITKGIIEPISDSISDLQISSRS